MEEEKPQISIDNFISIIRDFTSDLSTTFPEYSYLWARWVSPDTTVSDYADLYQYCLKVYPERFFDILYQNDEIFLLEKTDEKDQKQEDQKKDEKISTLFLPYVEFKILFNCEGISENTKKTIWKYLQLIMVTIMGDIQDKSVFGDTANLFDGIEEGDLHTKLAETINGLSNFFKTSGMDSEEIPELEKVFEESNETFKNMFTSDMSGSSIPNPDDLNDHLKTLFGGKIGTLAKELAEELSEDVMKMFGEDGGENITSTQDVLKKIMRNPKKMMDLLKTVSSKLDSKMKNGDISQSDIMKEAGDLMGKMKDMGGGKEFQDMMRNMTKGMAGMSGMGGKNTRFDKGAMDRMMKSESMKERMRNKLQEKSINKSVILESSPTNPQNMVFKIDGDEGQQKSSARPMENNKINDDWLDEPIVSNKTNQLKTNKSGSGSSGKKKKGKK